MTEPTLIDFLRDRLDERERRALAASNPDEAPEGAAWVRMCWHTEEYPPSGGFPCRDCCVVDGDSIHIYDEGGHDAEQAQHIADNDPRFVLADVAAKRRVLDEFKAATAFSSLPDTPGGGYASALAEVARVLALPHAAHPDYRPEWAPDAS